MTSAAHSSESIWYWNSSYSFSRRSSVKYVLMSVLFCLTSTVCYLSLPTMVHSHHDCYLTFTLPYLTLCEPCSLLCYRKQQLLRLNLRCLQRHSLAVVVDLFAGHVVACCTQHLLHLCRPLTSCLMQQCPQLRVTSNVLPLEDLPLDPEMQAAGLVLRPLLILLACVTLSEAPSLHHPPAPSPLPGRSRH